MDTAWKLKQERLVADVKAREAKERAEKRRSKVLEFMKELEQNETQRKEEMEQAAKDRQARFQEQLIQEGREDGEPEQTSENEKQILQIYEEEKAKR